MTSTMREDFEKEYGQESWFDEKYSNVRHNFIVGYTAGVSSRDELLRRALEEAEKMYVAYWESTGVKSIDMDGFNNAITALKSALGDSNE